MMISLATPGRATIIRRRGKGNFHPFEERYSAPAHMRTVNLSREKEDSYESDGSIIQDKSELKEYLRTIDTVDDLM